MKKNIILLSSCLILAFQSCFTQSAGWLSWRGPSANGSTPETNWNLNKINAGNALLWKTNVGTGHSAVAVRGNKVYTMGNFEVQENNFLDRVVCLDASTGNILWHYDYAMKELEDPGPFSTPVIDGTYLYTLSRGGHLHCFDADKGTVVWEKHLVDQQLIPGDAELACSPLIMDDLLILNINKNGLALNKRTGETVWSSDPNKSSLSTAVPYMIGGKRWITIQDDDSTSCVDPQSGEVLWIIPEAFITDPLIVDDRMLVFSYKGSSLYNIASNPPTRIWNNPALKARLQSFVERGDFAYGFINQGGDKLICFESGTGTIKWTEKVSAGSLIISNGILILIDKEGILRFIEASPNGYNELASAPVIEMAATDTRGKDYRRICGCWTNPVLCDGKIYVRNTYGELVCLDVGA